MPRDEKMAERKFEALMVWTLIMCALIEHSNSCKERTERNIKTVVLRLNMMSLITNAKKGQNKHFK